MNSISLKMTMIDSKIEQITKIPIDIDEKIKKLYENIKEYIDKTISDRISALDIIRTENKTENKSTLKLSDLLILNEKFDAKAIVEFRNAGII